MEADATKQGARTGGGGDGGGSVCDDRLSALPDDQLRGVLSFLPAQLAVRTTVLSRRWKDLWRSVPGVNLDLAHFRKARHEPWAETSARMVSFVSKFLSLHDAPRLDAFRFAASFVDHRSLRHIDTWIRRAIRGNPLVLEIRTNLCGGHGLYQLPLLSYSPCRRLERLKLSGVSLDHSFTEQLHSWWPCLEDLVLIQCHVGFCCIESDRLKNLAIQYCTSTPPADVFVIRASVLAALSLAFHNEDYRSGVSLHVSSSLVRASISLKGGQFSPRCEAMILGSLSNVTSLEIKEFQAMAILDKDLFDELPIFHNMRTLTFSSSTMCDVHNFKALGRFLQKVPELEMLTLENFWVAPTVEMAEYPTLENLGTLILDSCGLHNNNFGLLQHCLRNSPNLEKLIVQYCKVSDGSTGGEGKTNSKKSESQNMVPLHCPKLKTTELRYNGRYDANIPILRRLLLGISAPNNSINLTSTKYRFMTC